MYLLAVGLASLGVSVAGQIDEIPLLIDKEMIDKQCFPRGRGGHCQSFLASEHIDERRFAYVGAADKCKFMAHVGGTFANVGVAYDEACCVDYHIVACGISE